MKDQLVNVMKEIEMKEKMKGKEVLKKGKGDRGGTGLEIGEKGRRVKERKGGRTKGKREK